MGLSTQQQAPQGARQTHCSKDSLDLWCMQENTIGQHSTVMQLVHSSSESQASMCEVAVSSVQPAVVQDEKRRSTACIQFCLDRLCCISAFIIS